MDEKQLANEMTDDDFEVAVKFDPSRGRFWLECDTNSFRRYCEKFAGDMQRLSADERAKVVSVEVVDAQGWGRHLEKSRFAGEL